MLLMLPHRACFEQLASLHAMVPDVSEILSCVRSFATRSLHPPPHQTGVSFTGSNGQTRLEGILWYRKTRPEKGWKVRVEVGAKTCEPCISA